MAIWRRSGAGMGPFTPLTSPEGSRLYFHLALFHASVSFSYYRSVTFYWEEQLVEVVHLQGSMTIGRTICLTLPG